MNDERSTEAPSEDDAPGLLPLVLLSLAAGGATGLIAGSFRLALEAADRLRLNLVEYAVARGLLGLASIVLLAAAATAAAAWMVRRFAPRAAGSGIPDVELVLRGRLPPQSLQHPPVKFLGGLLAIGTGQALGREGPSVEMGAVVSGLLARLFGRKWHDQRALIAAGAGAGLATAFNAPIAGAVFVIEEMVRRFETRTILATLGASTAAITVARLLVGQAPDFTVDTFQPASPSAIALYMLLGLILGAVGVGYNRAILAAQVLADWFSNWSVELRAAAIGAVVGLLLCAAPQLAGGGEALTQQILHGTIDPRWLVVLLIVRFGLGPLSYAAHVPGGLFAPLLVLGAGFGLGVGLVLAAAAPDVAPPPSACAVVGMAALFTAVVRSPVTGIVLLVEMTGSDALLLPMLAACLTAMAIPTAFRCPPIYDSLRDRTAEPIGE